MSQPLYSLLFWVSILALDFRGENPCHFLSRKTSNLNARRSLPRSKLAVMRRIRTSLIGRNPAELAEKYASADAAALEAEKPAVRVAGAFVALRLHGKAEFAHISAQAALADLRETGHCRPRGRLSCSN